MTNFSIDVIPYQENRHHFVTWHSPVGMALVRGKWRCRGCGHRLTVNGIPPVESRRMPPWTWHLELIDRRRARGM